MKKWLKNHPHIWVACYALIYGPWFYLLEQHVTENFYILHCSLDDKIPFVEYFIIPYTLWFFYVGTAFVYFFFRAKRREFYQMTGFLFTGMTLFLIISTFFPNGLALRPDVFPRENVCTEMVRHLYHVDTPTNVLPSIHVYNTLGVMIAVNTCERLQNHRVVKLCANALGILIVLSTLFLKQHSVIDVTAGLFMAAGFYLLFYYLPERKRLPDSKTDYARKNYN